MNAPFTTLIDVAQLQALIASGQPLLVFDCSFDLTSPAAGEQQFEQAHIPGAVYAHLDRDLSDKTGAADAASGGRHPLPSRETFAAWLRSVGLSADMQVVVVDRQGANYCGRLWWMLKWCGHEAVAVLDGGLQAWQAAGGSVASGPDKTSRPTGDFTLSPARARLVSAQQLFEQLGHPDQVVLDARATPRFRGEVEPLDPVAGHIPGALNRPFGLNLTQDGHFKSAAQLRQEFDTLLAGRDPASVVHHCGSGVSAIPNVLGMEIAGLGRAALFAGSWSEWCNTPGLPIAQG
ncbi:sulfurtransferase [Hydrogenophaga defluvii]|uniref:Sulfurtransferase n=1 Tax=Hydrogenophaga defluvii TaxID=249410 RepID=A0ABW2SHC3_9BURK